MTGLTFHRQSSVLSPHSHRSLVWTVRPMPIVGYQVKQTQNHPTFQMSRSLPLRKARFVKSSRGFVTMASPPERSDILSLQVQPCH